jgi:adenosylhomocysteine nucleosidase
MTDKILVAFAMKQEFAPWRRRHRFHRVAASPWPLFATAFGETKVNVVLVGAGARETGGLRALARQLRPSLAIVTGVAAGLQPEWRPGDILVAQTVTGADGEAGVQSAAQFVDLTLREGAKLARTLITLPRIARTAAEKDQLASLADAADMESLPLMKLWSEWGIPSLALRVILDPVELPMTCDFEAAMDSHGQVQISRMFAQLARHPQLLPDFLRLARQSRRVLKLLADFLDRFFEGLATRA